MVDVVERRVSNRVGGRVEIEYSLPDGTPAPGKTADCRPAIPICGEDIEIVPVRYVILRVDGKPVTTPSEVREDLAFVNAVWAQCCFRVEAIEIVTRDPPPPEPFQDIGFDHDNDPSTSIRGRGESGCDKSRRGARLRR